MTFPTAHLSCAIPCEPPMLQTIVIKEIDQLDSLRLVWQRLWQVTPGATFFQTLDWLSLYWRHYGTDQQLRVFLVEHGDETVGLVPLVVRAETTRLGTMRVLTYPLHDWGTFFGPLGTQPTASLCTCFQQLAGQRRDWDLLDLRWVNRVELDRGRTPTALSAAGLAHLASIYKTTALIDFSGDWEQYLASRSSKFRNNLRRAEAAARQAGTVTFERYRPAGWQGREEDVRSELFDECLGLAARSWQGQSTNGTTLSHPTVRDFFRDLFVLTAEHGALDLNLLRLDGRLAAFSFNLVTDGVLAGLRLGYDPNQAAWSPGRILLARSLADSFQRGDLRLDLGSESMPFKREWLTRTLDAWRYTHYPRMSVRSQLLRLKHRWFAPSLPAATAK